MTDDEWDDVLETDLGGFYNVVRPTVMPMVSARKGGRIVTIASVWESPAIAVRSITVPPRPELSVPPRRWPLSSPRGISPSIAWRRVSLKRRWSRICRWRRCSRWCRCDAPANLPMWRLPSPICVRRRRLRHAPGSLGQWGHDLMRRVVVTGMGGITALGNSWPEIRAHLARGETAIRYLPEWERSAASIRVWRHP